MKRILLFFLSFVYLYSQAQKTITVLGWANYTSKPTTYIYKISPVIHPHAPEDFARLNYILDSLGVTYSVDSLHETWRSPDFQKTIDYATNTLEDFKKLITGISAVKMGGTPAYLFERFNQTYLDSLASKAVHNAKFRANKMADHLGKKLIRIRNIDDQVDPYYFLIQRYPAFRKDREKADFALQVLEHLAGNGLVSNSERSSDEVTSSYALWVTFDIK